MTLNRKYPRTSGVLMPITSLDGPFGVGVLGQEAFAFVDFVASAGFHAWQVLPIEHFGSCNSPYKCKSAYAGAPMLIDLRMLRDIGLLSDEELYSDLDGMSDTYVDFDRVRIRQRRLLKTAFSRIAGDCSGHNSDYHVSGDLSDLPNPHDYKKFNPFWFDNYALFMAISYHFGGAPWYEWHDMELRRCNPKAVSAFKAANKDEIEFYRFVQWLFDLQWKRLKKYAKSRDISIIGDMPIYVSEDSADVWCRRELFYADDNGKFSVVSGVPPDYYAKDGQLWGNPVYNWALLKKENYKWWIRRLKASLSRYDLVRLDHFRAFSSFWKVPGSAKTAREGKWEKGPGMSLFRALNKSLGDLSLSVIAEDLGILDDDVEKLLADTGLRGMRIMQFGFLGDSHHKMHTFTEDSVAYTGTHDNNTLYGFMCDELSDERRSEAFFYLDFTGDYKIGGPNCPIAKSWIRLLFMSSSSIVVVPIQDILGYGADTRTNIPGVPVGNWRFRIRSGVLGEVDIEFYKQLHVAFERMDKVKKSAPK